MDGPERRRRTSRRAQWPLTLALLLLLLAACATLGPLLRGSVWWWPMALTGSAVLLGAALLRRTRLAPSLVPIAALGVLLATLTILFGRGSGLLWLIPTPETFDRFQVLIVTGTESIERQSIPAEPIEGILFLLAAGAGLIAALMDILAITLRRPALAGLAVLIPVAVPGILVDEGINPATLVVTAAAYLLVLRVDVRTRRLAEAENPPVGRGEPRVVSPARPRGSGPLWGSVTVGSIGIVSALVLSTATPSLTDGTLFTGTRSGELFGAGISPMIDLGQDLRRPLPSPALHYTTTAEEPPYFKILTLDDFAGTTWTARAEPLTRTNTVDRISKPPGLVDIVETTTSTTDVVIDGVVTNLLPAPTPVSRVDGLRGQWFWNDRTRTITSPDNSTRGQEYTVTALELQPTAQQLRDSRGRYPVSVAPMLVLPFPRPEIIGETLDAVTRDATSKYDAALAIQDYLREFRYDTEAPVDEGYDGGGLDVIGTFLEVKRGYCVHFASAMAVMARLHGIPARIAVGYLPGTRDTGSPEGSDRYNVDSHDLHSWPELYFVNVGWVPFEPTPGRGTVPDYALPPDAATPTQAPDTAAPTQAPRNTDPGLNADTGSLAGGAAQNLDALVRVVLSLLVALAVFLTPGMVRAIRRIRRMRRLRSGRAGAEEAWTELTDCALDLGVRVRGTETPRELAGRLDRLPGLGGDPAPDARTRPDARAAPPEATAALERLLVAAERERYARPGAEHPQPGPRLAGDLDLVIRTIRAGAEPRARIIASLLPASLWVAIARRGDGRTPQGA